MNSTPDRRAAGVQGIRGMHDLLPADTPLWQHIEATLRRILKAYGYREIRLPIVERTELFARSIGEVTDIVEKEMYTFTDRNGDSLSLRPEGTAGCVRALIEHGLLATPGQRLWYQGPMFRHERPQKGRYRQFHQVGVEVFGLEGPDIDAELLAMTARLWRALGIAGDVRLEINSLGTPQERARYRTALVDYLSARKDRLDEDAHRRLTTNPLRILDSKDPGVREAIAEAPLLGEFIEESSRAHFDGLRARLDDLGMAFTINHRLVRGLDYYALSVFEWITDSLGAQGTVCAGGRYDGLVAQLGGTPTPAIGFAIGLERIAALVAGHAPVPDPAPHCYVIAPGAAGERAALVLAEALRESLPGLSLVVNCGGGSFKAQFRRADRSGARYALVIGDDEAAAGEVGIKPLRGDGEQMRLPQSALAVWLAQHLSEVA